MPVKTPGDTQQKETTPLHSMVDPQRFVAQDLSLAPVARGQSAVVLGGLRIGRVRHAVDGAGKSSWLWELTGPSGGTMPERLATCGDALTLADAKLQLRSAFDTWLNWAMAQDGPVQWHSNEAVPGRGGRGEGDGLALAG